MRRSFPWITNRARVLRSQDLSAEHRLWSALRNWQLGGFRFVRREAIGEYFADLACRELRPVVEVDGATHATSEESSRDERRDAYLARRGDRVMRVSNEDVRANLSGVLDTIMLELRSRVMSTTIQRAAPHPSPLPAGGERE